MRAGDAPSSRLAPALAVALGGIALSWNLGGGSLLASDDVIYARMAWEMADAGRWLDATWQGVVLFEKPPLLFWLLRLSGGLLGWSDGAMRLPGVVAGILSLVFVARLAWRAAPAGADRGLSAAVAVALTAATTTFVMMTRRPLTDPLLMCAVLAMLDAATLPGASRPLRRGAAIGLAGGLAVLAKWVAAGPAALVVAVALVTRRRWSSLGVAGAVGLLVAAPWHVALTARHGASFWEVYLGYHVADRATSALVGAPSASYYLDTALDLDPLLTLVLLMGLVAFTIHLVLRRRAGVEPASAAVVALAWLTLLAIHVAGTRLFHYALPVVPLAAIATAASLQRLPRAPLGAMLGGAVALVGFVTGPLDPHLTDPDYSRWTREVSERHLRALPAETELVVWEAYDPAVTWYARRPARLWTADQRFYDVQQSVDMMRRSAAVVWASDAALEHLIAMPGPVVFVAPRAEAVASLVPWLRRASAKRRVRILEGTVSEPRVVMLAAAAGGAP